LSHTWKENVIGTTGPTDSYTSVERQDHTTLERCGGGSVQSSTSSNLVVDDWTNQDDAIDANCAKKTQDDKLSSVEEEASTRDAGVESSKLLQTCEDGGLQPASRYYNYDIAVSCGLCRRCVVCALA